MLSFVQKIETAETVFSSLTLTFDQRVRSRLKVVLDNGMDAGLFLARGSMLQQGDFLQAESGEVIKILAAKESVSTVTISDPLIMARASYHLGNRHVPLQISEGFIRYQHDHVLDEMVEGLGLVVTSEFQSFEPEPGAYKQQGSGHSHQHTHEHGKSNHEH